MLRCRYLLCHHTSLWPELMFGILQDTMILCPLEKICNASQTLLLILSISCLKTIDIESTTRRIGFLARLTLLGSILLYMRIASRKNILLGIMGRMEPIYLGRTPLPSLKTCVFSIQSFIIWGVMWAYSQTTHGWLTIPWPTERCSILTPKICSRSMGSDEKWRRNGSLAGITTLLYYHYMITTVLYYNYMITTVYNILTSWLRYTIYPYLYLRYSTEVVLNVVWGLIKQTKFNVKLFCI